jgi:hypothetical protein
MQWTADAEQALKEVPFFVRPAVRKRIETMAKEANLDQIDLGVLVGLSVIARPSSLLTFALIALAGQMRGGRRRD